MGNFTHLRTHTSYSLKDGLLSEDEIRKMNEKKGRK